jgi:hypothetical protein
MALKRSHGPAGSLVVLEHRSKVLADNPLGDPHERRLAVWLPPQYENSTRQRFPVLYDLVGFTGSGFSHLNWKPFGDNVPERAARLIHERKMAPAILVFPDCFTALGGNQYINSTAVGQYAAKSCPSSTASSAPRRAASTAAVSASLRAATAPSSTA